MSNADVSEVTELAGQPVNQRAYITSTVFGDLIQFADFAVVALAAAVLSYIYHTYVLFTAYDFQIYAAAGIMGATLLTALLRRDGFYDFDQLMTPAKYMSGIFARWSLVLLGLLAFAFSLKITADFSRAWLFTWAGASMALLFAIRVAAGAALQRLVAEGGVFARRIAGVGATESAAAFADIIKKSGKAIDLVGVYRLGTQPTVYENAFDLTGDLAQLAADARRGDIDDVVIAKPGATQEELHALVTRVSILPVSISICSSLQWLEHKGGEIVRIGGARMLSLYRRPLEGWGGILKILEDRVGGLILLILASPIMALIALGIKLQGKGPILFSQKQHGFNHSVFNIYKFRTMTVAEDGDEIRQATLDDVRITPLGKILRRYSLDELPQLLNVVAGDMSLVGPRPHALAHNHQYTQTVENYSGRHKVKPGITGWAQVNGCRGETSENEMMAERVRYDLEYVDNWSLWFDCKILVLTVKAVLFPKNAY